MPISQTDQLFKLIKSLTKAEKRNFTVYASRLQDIDTLKYVQLFEIIDKLKDCDDDAIIAKLKTTDKSQYSNLKRHLYKQLMISLRLVYINKKTDIEIREYLDFADILYSKGLYLQSIKLIEKAKGIAKKSSNHILRLALLEAEKTIESRHITRSGTDNTFEMTTKALEVSETIVNSTKLSNLMLLVHAFYIRNGHVKNDDELAQVNEFFDSNLPKVDIEKLNFNETIYLYQSLVWYYYIIHDFQNCLVYAENWVSHFKKHPEMIQHDPDLFMRGYHYLLTSAFYLNEVERFVSILSDLEVFRKSNYKKFSPNSQIISFLYVHHGRLNKYFLLKRYDEGLKACANTLKRMSKYNSKLDLHRIMVFYFKIAWMNLMAKKPSIAIDYLNEIQKMELGALREDIQIYTRLMLLMAHYDMGNFDIMEYLTNNAKQLSIKFQDVNQVQLATINFFNRVVKIPLGDRKMEFKKFNEEVEMLKSNLYERRAFIYLDISEWLKYKI